MELVVFDLDGTLLNRDSALSGRTAETLRRLAERGIAYTVATGRMLHGSRELLEGHGFRLPLVLKNGVMIWNPGSGHYSHVSILAQGEIQNVLAAVMAQHITPFIFTLEPGNIDQQFGRRRLPGQWMKVRSHRGPVWGKRASNARSRPRFWREAGAPLRRKTAILYPKLDHYHFFDIWTGAE